MSTPLPADLREALGTPRFTEAVMDRAFDALPEVRAAVLQWDAAKLLGLPASWQDRPAEQSPFRHLSAAQAADVEALVADAGADAAEAHYDAAGREALEAAGVPAGAMRRLIVLHTCREAAIRMGTHGVDAGAWRAHIRHLECRPTPLERDLEEHSRYMKRIEGW